jgi:D-alanyl-D-alanine dipeptidase
MGLLVYDAYRPERGTAAMVAWAQRTDQVHLLDAGYIARHSGHNHGHSIDLTVVDLETGEPIEMGTPWDTFNETSHTVNAVGPVLANRMILKDAMRAHGFTNYAKEWWHYRYAPVKHTRPLDVPYGRCEEDTFTAPDGWSKPGWVVPDTPPFVPCP